SIHPCCRRPSNDHEPSNRSPFRLLQEIDMNATRNQGRRLAIAGFAVAIACLHAALSTPDAARRAAETALNFLAGSAHATDLFVESTGVGIGIENPQRQLHLRGNNAAF